MGGGIEGVRSEVKIFFQNNFAELMPIRPGLDGVSFRCSSSSDNAILYFAVTMEEIKESIRSCGGNKSPGLDGFKLNFFKTHWDFLKSEVCALLEAFLANGKLPKGVSSSFLALIRKKKILNLFRNLDRFLLWGVFIRTYPSFWLLG